MAIFLKIQDPTTGVGTVLNVATFGEEELQWQGDREQAFNGAWLSMERDPLRNYTATVEFLTPPEVELFRKACYLYDNFGRPASPKIMLMVADADGALRGAPALKVHVIFGKVTPKDYAKPGGGITQSWLLDLKLQEQF